jgi:hypothetical protein
MGCDAGIFRLKRNFFPWLTDFDDRIYTALSPEIGQPRPFPLVLETEAQFLPVSDLEMPEKTPEIAVKIVGLIEASASGWLGIAALVLIVMLVLTVTKSLI